MPGMERNTRTARPRSRMPRIGALRPAVNVVCLAGVSHPRELRRSRRSLSLRADHAHPALLPWTVQGDSMAGPILTLLAVAGYGVLHSVLARRWAKRRARQTLGPAADRFYRLIYNLVGGATLLPVLAVVGLEPGELLYRLPLPWSAIALVGQALAALVIVLGLLQTDLRHFLGLRQMIRGGEGPPSPPVVSGLYRWVRHPLYSAGL